jgi:spermidine synthase
MAEWVASPAIADGHGDRALLKATLPFAYQLTHNRLLMQVDVCPPSISSTRRSALALPLFLYTCTGFTGLLIEQCFEKYLLLLVGGTVTSSSLVIFAYFLGFALGGFAVAELQKRSRITRPLLVYGALELLVGAAAVLFTFLFHPAMEWLGPIQGSVSNPLARAALRFLFGCLFVLPPASLMGASFPLIAHVVDRRARSGGSLWAKAYTGNLCGAVAAALLGPYWIYPSVGVQGAVFVSFCLCAAVFVTALWLDHRDTFRAAVAEQKSWPVAEAPCTPIGTEGWSLLAAAFASGLVVFALEVVWTQLISVVLGCSVYAFSAMLSMVLLGLLIGSWHSARELRHGKTLDYRERFRLCALTIVIQYIGWGTAPLLFCFTPPRPLQNFAFAESWRMLVAAALILPSAAALGTLFPSLLGAQALRKPGRSFLIGYMNAANAIGSEIGTLLGVFVLIPLAGSELSLCLITVALLCGSLAIVPSAANRPVLARGLIAALITLTPLAVWHWDRFVVTSALGITFGSPRAAGGKTGPADGPLSATTAPLGEPKIVFFREAAQGGITTVVKTQQKNSSGVKTVRTLYTNGKFEGDDDVEGQRDAQFGVAALATQFVENTEHVLLIGLGTGHSAASLRQLGYAHVDVAEFSPGIIEAARTRFRHLNRGVLSDPAVSLRQEDGRNVLIETKGRTYDLITVEISSIWFAGSTNLYSAEFYQHVRARLKAGGVLQQWVQLHHISPAEIGAAIATARTQFPYVSFWCYGKQGFLIATTHPQQASPERLARLRAALPGELVERLQASRLLRPAAVDRMIAATGPRINTDHNRYIEYATPRYYAGGYDWMAYNTRFLTAFDRDSALP